MRKTATIALEGFGVPESLRWHEQALWFSDLAHGGVYRWQPGAERAEKVIDIPGRAGGLGWLPDGRLLVASMDGRVVYRLEDGNLVEHADLRDVATGPVNDMVVSDTGYAYVGNFGFDYYTHARQHSDSALYAPPGPPSARLACIAPDGRLLSGNVELLFPNGCVITGSGTLVVAETLGLRLTEFAIADDGSICDPRMWAPLIAPWMWRGLNNPGFLGRAVRAVSKALDNPWIAKHSASPIAPDGICLGSDETIWAANALRGECVRVSRGGRILDRVRTSQHTLSCVIAGDAGRTLFLATTPTADPVEAAMLNGGRIEVYEL